MRLKLMAGVVMLFAGLLGTPNGLVAQDAVSSDAATVSSASEAMTPAEALKSLGKGEVVVEMTVRAAKNRLDKRGVVYLDSQEDFAHPENLGVALSVAVAKELELQGVEDPAEHFQGQTIRVRGCLMRLEERIYLPVLDAAQIEIVKPGSPPAP